MKDIQGNDVPLSKFKGKVVLVVNVASQCGYTNSNYNGLVQLQKLLGTEEFAVVAFPCNQFGHQEPDKNSAIEKFAKEKYNVNFDMFAKIQVVGADAHPLYKFLADQAGTDPTWNFCKYLITEAGEVQGFWGQNVSPQSLLPTIQNLLAVREDL